MLSRGISNPREIPETWVPQRVNSQSVQNKNMRHLVQFTVCKQLGEVFEKGSAQKSLNANILSQR
jgi:hypothetical protein